MRKLVLVLGLVIGLASIGFSDPWTETGNRVWDGSVWQKMKGDTNGELSVNTEGLDRSTNDAGLIGSGSIDFLSTDDISVEQLSTTIAIGSTVPHLDNIYLLAIEKDNNTGAGGGVIDRDLTITTYNEITIDGTNSRNVTHSTHTVEANSGADVYRDYLVQGLFIGEGEIKIGAKFASDATVGRATESTVYYRLYKF